MSHQGQCRTPLCKIQRSSAINSCGIRRTLLVGRWATFTHGEPDWGEGEVLVHAVCVTQRAPVTGAWATRRTLEAQARTDGDVTPRPRDRLDRADSQQKAVHLVCTTGQQVATCHKTIWEVGRGGLGPGGLGGSRGVWVGVGLGGGGSLIDLPSYWLQVLCPQGASYNCSRETCTVREASKGKFRRPSKTFAQRPSAWIGTQRVRHPA